MSLSSLEKALHAYTLGPATQPFDMKTVPVAPVEEEPRGKVRMTTRKQLKALLRWIFTDNRLKFKVVALQFVYGLVPLWDVVPTWYRSIF